MIQNQRSLNARGFTVVEMMVATAVFSVVLLVCSIGLIQISRSFYKGVTVTTTQETARGVIDEIANSITYSGSNPSGLLSSGPNRAYCIGATRISFLPGRMLGDVPHVLVADSPPVCSAPLDLTNPSLPGAVNPRELVAERMRVAKLVITPQTNRLYFVELRLVTGDDDALQNDNSPTADCSGLLAGAQFCASVELTTTVQKRIQ